MLAHPTLELLHALAFTAWRRPFKELDQNTEAHALSHAEWLGLLLEHEATLRRQKRFEARARAARLRHPASVEDVIVSNWRRRFAATAPQDLASAIIKALAAR